MKTLKKIGIALLIILFPLGMLYCLIHALGKDFICFIGCLLFCGCGILLGIYLVEPELITTWFQTFLGWLPFIK